LIILIAGWVIYKNIDYGQSKKAILADYEKTYGKIIGYSEIGTHRSTYHEYEYIVDGFTYTRRFNSGYKMSECHHELTQKCLSKRFWVIYLKEDPSISLIDLSNDIQGIKNPEFPKSLANFK
jgi:hypothetical protein